VLAATLFFATAFRRTDAQPVTRADAERAALSAGPRVALARADTAAARAALITARARPNPSLAATYSKSAPQQHVILDVPIDAPWSRGLRVGAATATARAARLRFLSERTAALLEVDTTYTVALAAQARFRLSRQTARDADSLRIMTAARRDAGDASDLDVDLATITAGQQWNVAATDSLTFMTAVLTVQTLMGIPADSATLLLADSLRLPARDATTPARGDSLAAPTSAQPEYLAGALLMSGAPGVSSTMPSIAAAEASLTAAELAVARERRSVIGAPSVQLGVEWGDPAEDPPNRLLPTVGVSIPLPLFNRNQGPIAEAQAQRERARVELAATRLTVRQRLMEGLRERESLRARVARDRSLVASAERVAAKSLTAYREGASGLPAVLEARRTARDVLGQYIDDVAALLTVESELRALTQTVPEP
jgi:cobalt-zinc-cadmium efflux system outer membrane protein